jgi:nitroreductase
MELRRVLRRRRMVRSFEPAELPDGALERILDAGRRAPSAGNTWGVHFLALTREQERSLYWDATLPVHRRASFQWPGLLRAPALVVVWVDPGAYEDRYSLPDKRGSIHPRSWDVPWWFVDAGMAIENMLLAAVDEGLGALFFGVFSRGTELRDAFGVPDSCDPIGTIAVGLPAEDDRPSLSQLKARPPMDLVVHWGRW